MTSSREGDLVGLFTKRKKSEPYAFANPGMYALEVVGEASYGDALARTAGRLPADERAAGRGYVFAQLVPEPTSRYDPNAVAVKIDGATVGYLSRAKAPVVGAVVREKESTGRSVWVRAVIVWHADEASGLFGVWLDIPADERLRSVPFVPLDSIGPHVVERDGRIYPTEKG